MATPISKKQILRQLERLSAEELAEVARFIEFLKTEQPAQESGFERGAAFGIWADYDEASDPAAFSLKLRRDLETRGDAFSNPAG